MAHCELEHHQDFVLFFHRTCHYHYPNCRNIRRMRLRMNHIHSPRDMTRFWKSLDYPNNFNVPHTILKYAILHTRVESYSHEYLPILQIETYLSNFGINILPSMHIPVSWILRFFTMLLFRRPWLTCCTVLGLEFLVQIFKIPDLPHLQS